MTIVTICVGSSCHIHGSEEIIGLLAYRSGLIDREEALSARELLGEFRWEKLKKDDIAVL